MTAFYILFDQPTDIPEPFQTSENGASIWVTGRVGYNVIPQLYVFAEGDGIFQRFANSVFNTDGYRVMGGLGTKDPNSLIRGEIYGGYQAQQQLTEAEFGTPSIPLLLPFGHPDLCQQWCFWWPSFLLSDPVLDAYWVGRPSIGNFDAAVARRSRGTSFEGDHRIGTDDLCAGAQLVGRRPGRLHSRLLLRALPAK